MTLLESIWAEINFGSICLGWTLGFLACWWHFKHHRLIRTREEWTEAERRRKKVEEIADYFEFNPPAKRQKERGLGATTSEEGSSFERAGVEPRIKQETTWSDGDKK